MHLQKLNDHSSPRFLLDNPPGPCETCTTFCSAGVPKASGGTTQRLTPSSPNGGWVNKAVMRRHCWEEELLVALKISKQTACDSVPNLKQTNTSRGEVLKHVHGKKDWNNLNICRNQLKQVGGFQANHQLVNRLRRIKCENTGQLVQLEKAAQNSLTLLDPRSISNLIT